MIEIRDVTIDPVLSQVSVAYSNLEYIADKIFLPIQGGRTGTYYKFDKAALRRNKTLRASTSKANEVELGLVQETYATTDHALKGKLGHAEMEEAEKNGVDLETAETEGVTEMILIDKEIALATSLTDTAVVTQNVTLSGTDQWSDYDNSDPFDDIKTARDTVQKAVGRAPNTLVLGQEAFNVLINHPDVVDRIKYTSGQSITPEMLARVFNFTNCYVGSAVYNSAVEGQTDSMAYIWGKHAIVAYIAPTVRPKQVTLGVQITKGTREVAKWDDMDAKTRYVRVNEEYVQEFVAVEAAYLIKNCVA